MDFQSAIETFAEAWVAAYTQTPLTEAAETQGLLLDMNREKVAQQQQQQQESGAPEASLRSPGSSSTALVEFRPKPPPLPSGRAIPVHCVVEQVSPQVGLESPVVPAVVLEDYAIIPSSTPFAELVRTALAKLGYSSPEALDAKGAIQLKNWKPLTFEQITESPEATVGDILYEVSTVATLRIRLYSRPKTHSANDVKEKLLQVLLAQSQNLLVSSGCPIDLSVLAALTKGRLECDIPDETRKKFDQWYLQQVFQHCRQVALLQQHVQQQQPQACPPQPPQVAAAGGPQADGCGPGSPAAPEPRGPRTRNRTSFDPELELPKLHRWFAENQHPSRLQIQQYVRELNSLESRRGRKPLDVNNVVYWFKNARAAHKRAEQKCCAESNGGAADRASSDDSDNMHTLDLSVRRACECVVKEEPRDSSSEHSLESSDSGDEMEVNVMDEPRPQNGAAAAAAADFRLEERRKRNRTFIDPVSEVPRLEQWFSANTHPSQGQIVRFTNELNSMQYRQKFPKLEPKNIQFWFKNRRAKCKRLNLAANLSEKIGLLPPDKMLLPAAN